MDGAIQAWQERAGRPPILIRHSMGFGWRTKEQLLSAKAFGLPLIAPEHIGTSSGDQTNLVKALRAGVAPYPQMPIQGPYLPEAEITEIIEWINNGAL